MSRSQWLLFGRWPSDHDLDLLFIGDEREAIEDLFDAHYDEEVNFALVPFDELPVPSELLEQAIALADGAVLDLKLTPTTNGLPAGLPPWWSPRTSRPL
jgi:hypothetical protein